MELRGVFYSDSSPELAERAALTAKRFGLEAKVFPDLENAKPRQLRKHLEDSASGAVFLWIESGLFLWDLGLDLRIQADFHGATVAYRVDKGGGRGQMIAKAVGLKAAGLRVFDATAGLGGDAFVLASLGCEVWMSERNPVVHCLLGAGLQVGRDYAERIQANALSASLSRMHLLEGDASSLFGSVASEVRPDVVYLDPMFPKKTKKALVKKEMQVLQSLVGPDVDARHLLDAALECAGRRVVVKRPRIAATITERAPDYVMEGKSNRYDIYRV